MKLEQGDTFENKYADWIRQRLPQYEHVWSVFIGHNGRGRPFPILGLDKPSEEDRKRFYQAHYSFACKMHVIESYASQTDKTSGLANDHESFEAELDRLFCLMASVGYVRDMFKTMDDSLSAKGTLCDPLQSFYAQRNHIIHGPRLPVRMSEEGLIMIPRIGGENKLLNEWDDKSAWDSIPANNFIYILDYAEDLTQDLFGVVNTVHGKVFYAADKRFDGKRISTQVMSLETLSPLSGISDTIYSFPPPSGRMNG